MRLEYFYRRRELVRDCDEGPSFDKISVPSQKLPWKDILGFDDEPVNPKYNEFYLFHGTSERVADAITDKDFYISQGKPENGDTFGNGVYMAEYVSHAHFFAEMMQERDGGDTSIATILVCRAFCGRINDVGNTAETSERHERAGEFEAALKSRKYHSTMGREWPSNYNVQEWVVADDDQVLPEFIVYCKTQAKV